MSELFREGLRRLEQEEKQQPAALQNLAAVVRLIQQDAKRVGLDKMTRRDINTEVEAARKDARANTKKSVARPRR